MKTCMHEEFEEFKEKGVHVLYMDSTFYISNGATSHLVLIRQVYSEDHAFTRKNIFSNISIPFGHILQMDVW